MQDPTYTKSVQIYEELIENANLYLEQMIKKHKQGSVQAEVAADHLYSLEKKLKILELNHLENQKKR